MVKNPLIEAAFSLFNLPPDLRLKISIFLKRQPEHIRTSAAVQSQLLARLIL
jgi:hypothetical protein